MPAVKWSPSRHRPNYSVRKPEAMPQFYVEGQFVNKQGKRKKFKTGRYPSASIEPYAKTIWANSAEEALQLASQELMGGEWTEGPHVSRVTEEQRMRSIGAPEFPGLSGPALKKRAPRAKRAR